MITKGITDCNYEPLVIKHTCTADRLGKEMTLEEKDKFVKEFLFEAYKNRGSNVEFHKEGDIDLSLNGGIRKALIVRFADENGNHSPFDANTVINAYHSSGVYPVLVLVSLLDMSIFKKTGAIGALLCGDEFCAKMSCISLLPEESGLECNKTDEELIDAIVTAWKNLDVSIFNEILHPRFNYSSSYILDIISCKGEYLKYITGKFDSIKSSGSTPEVGIGLMQGQKVVVLRQNGNPPAALRFVSEGGKIFDMEMTNYVEDTAPLSKYELEFRWIPSLVDAFNKGDIPQQALSDIRWWKESLKKMGSNRF